MMTLTVVAIRFVLLPLSAVHEMLGDLICWLCDRLEPVAS